MPRKAPKSPKNASNGSSNQGWLGFVDLKLTPALWDRMKETYDGSPEFFTQMCDDLTLMGYKLSFSSWGSTRTFSASATGKHPECPNDGYTLSSFGPSLGQALWATYFKIRVVAEDGIWQNAQLMLPGAEAWG